MIKNVFLLVSILIIAICILISIYKILNTKVTYRKYYPNQKLAIQILLVLPWILLFFPFTTDWSTYWMLFLIRLPYTIIWFLIMLLALWVDLKSQKKYQKHKK